MCQKQWAILIDSFRLYLTVLPKSENLQICFRQTQLRNVCNKQEFHISHPDVFLLTHIISLLSVIHNIYSIMQTKIQGLHLSTVYGHLQALFLN